MSRLSEFFNNLNALFRRPRYAILSAIVAVLFFSFIALLRNFSGIVQFFRVNSFFEGLEFVWILVLGYRYTVGVGSFVFSLAIAVLFGILISLVFARASNLREMEGTSFMSAAGLALGVIAPTCAACGAGLVAWIGISGAFVASLPLAGLEFSIVAVFLLVLSIWNLSLRLNMGTVCEVKLTKPKMKGGTK